MPDIRDWLADTYNSTKDFYIEILEKMQDNIADAAPNILTSAIIVGVSTLSAIVVGHTAVFMIYLSKKRKRKN